MNHSDDWRFQAALPAPRAGAWQLLLHVPNPLPNGAPLRLAHQNQDQHLRGWCGLPCVVFPGNVGGSQALLHTVASLKPETCQTK
jgi:hypothetical protein